MSNTMDSTLKRMNEIFQEKLGKLLSIWDELGHDESVISERFQTVIKHNTNFLDELVDESENEKAQILNDIDAALKKIHNLRHRLRITTVMEGYVDTPLVLLVTQLDDLIKQYEREIQSKMQNINKLLQDEVNLCRKLGTTPKKLATKPLLPTPEEISEYEKYVERMNQQVFELEEQFLQIKCDIMQMLEDLGKPPTTDFEHGIMNNDENAFILSTENMTKLKQWHVTLKQDVQERRGEINELRQKLLSLWELLEEDASYRTDFISRIEGIGEDTLRTLKDEIIRCNEKKKAHIKEYIDKYRTDIEKWWENCKYGMKQRSDFMALYKSECYTDDLLMLHELQLEKLKLYYNNNKKIFDLIQKRDQLWQRYIYLSECANNKDRFKNRGGELLREEKERKEVNVQLPQIENQLISELHAYKEKHQTDFLIDDKPLEAMIHEHASRFREKKSATLSAKKKQRDITMTPNQNGRSILTNTNLTASKRKAQPLRTLNNKPSTVPSKRSRIVDEQQQPQPSSSCAKTTEKQTSRPCASRTGTVPKLKVNDHTVGKVSYCVRRRLCPTKRLSRESANSSRTRRKAQQSQTVTSTESSDEYYNQFMVGISSRSSTVHQQKENKTPRKTQGRSPCTPRTPATIKPRTPRTPRTAKTPDTPRTVTRLQVASPLPFLF